MQNNNNKLTNVKREILEYIVERSSNYNTFDAHPLNVVYNSTVDSTVDSWVAHAVDKLENDDISSINNEGC